MKVLIADDSKLIRKRLMKFLLSNKAVENIIEAENFQESLEAIKNKKPAVILLDIHMPGGSGIDVLKNIKTNSYSPTVIMFTNHPLPKYKSECMRLGADYFFDKSNEFTKVIELFKNLQTK